MNRDPMKEFFTLTCQAVKINSPQMNAICTIDTNALYDKVNQQGIPFFKWSSWIDDYINKEFLRMVIRSSRRKGMSDKPMNKTFVKVEKTTERMVLEKAKQLQRELEAHQKAKGKKPADLKVKKESTADPKAQSSSKKTVKIVVEPANDVKKTTNNKEEAK